MKTFLILLSIAATSLYAKDKVIYGDDNRVDVYANTNPLYADLAKSTAAMISHSKLTKNGTTTTISGGTLEERGMCSNIKFAEQITAANCSGFLVGPDLMVSAGHCIRGNMNPTTNQMEYPDCATSSWVFDFAVESEGESAREVPTSSVYNCVEVLEQKLDRNDQNDFVLFRLDRPVTDRAPLTVRKTGKITDNQSIVVIGHPTGLPTKIADGANVRSNSNPVFFVANLDTFGGNSGSAVFNAETGEVEGILVRGENDYVWDTDLEGKRCRVPQVCSPTGCRGEDVTRITNIKKLMEIVNQ
ncbi:MAG: hypothetical protein Fur0010_20910 [Bdellovibrio sp.]